MLIKVTQEHIDKGSPGVAESCPVALACNDAMPGTHCSVSESMMIVFTDYNTPNYVSFGKDITAKISDFDATGFMKPFQFELNI